MSDHEPRLPRVHREILTALLDGTAVRETARHTYQIGDREYTEREICVLYNDGAIDEDDGQITTVGRAMLMGDWAAVHKLWDGE